MPKVKITGLPKVKIVDIPKAVLGMQVTDTTTASPNTSMDINGCVIGQEIWSEADQRCMPIEGGYDPSQDANKGTPITGTTNASGQAVGGTGAVQQPFHNTDGANVPDKQCPPHHHKDPKTGYCVHDKRKIDLANQITQQTLAFGNALATVKQNDENKKAAENKMRQKSFQGTVVPASKDAFGHVETVSGIEYPNMMTPPNEGMFSNYIGRSVGQFGGSFLGQPSQGVSRIKILDEPGEPEMKYGGQSNYGFDSGWRRSYTEMNKTSSDNYTNSMSEKKGSDEEPVLEAEGGETIYKPGDETFFNLNGPKHTNGGIKLTADQVNSKTKDLASFIYSDTNKLKIKDEEVLKHFGFKYKKGGITPATISKKFDLNKYKAILQDPDTDNLSKDTAQLGMNKNQKYLAELAAVQESMKGNEMPDFAKKLLQQKGQAKYGGYVPEYAIGGEFLTTDVTTKAPTEGATFTPEQIEAMKGKNVTVSAKMKSGISTVPYHQGASKTKGYYGDVTPADLEDLKKRHPWYFDKHSNWNPENENDVEDFQKAYNEEYAKKNGYTYFVLKGSKEDRKFNRLDKKLGRYTYNAPALDITVPTTTIPPSITLTTTVPVSSKPEYICIPDGKGGGQVVMTGTGGGYSSYEEAAKHCGERPKRPPFDYLAPDKVNMFAHQAVFPRQIFPFYSDLPYNNNPVALEDWRAKAAQRFSTQYAAPAAQLATYGPTQGLAANLSFLAGQTGQQMAAEDIAPTISRNVDRVNANRAQEAQRQDSVTAYNAQNKDKRWAGYATTLQNYDNAMRQYLKENSDAFTRAWKNRMHLGEINNTSRNFLLDPTSGGQTWKGNVYGGINGLPSGSSGDNGDLSTEYNDYYNKAFETLKGNTHMTEKEKDARAHEIAMSYIRSSKVRQTYDPYKNRMSRTSYDFDFGDNSGYR